jgi:cytochrome P450
MLEGKNMSSLKSYERFLTRESLQHPYELYRESRETAPIFRTQDPKGREVLVVTTYPLVKEIFGRPEDFSNLLGPFLTEGTSNAEADAILNHGPTGKPLALTLLLILDDPEHKRLRSIVNRVFTPKRIAELSQGIERIVHDLIDDYAAKGEVDFLHDFAALLPIHVILDVLGIDRKMARKAQLWSDAILVRVSHLGSHDEEIEAAKLILEMQQFMFDAIQARRKTPQNDLITDIVNARLDDGEGLTDDQIVPLLGELLIAGNETTRNSLMGGMTQFLRNPEQLRALIEEPSLSQNAVEEVLRLFSPKAGMWRIAARDTELGGVPIAKGATVMVRMDSANRDDAQFPNGEAFDIRRANARTHLAFGFGVHNCLGNLLARKELQVAFPILFDRMKNPRIDEDKSDLGRHPSVLMHTLHALTVNFEPVQPVLAS